MMVKLLTSLVIIAGCTLIGFIYSNRFSMRMRLLIQFQSALHLLETHIIYTALPLPEAFDRVGTSVNGPVGAFFHRLVEDLTNKTGLPLSILWRQAVESDTNLSVLKKEDMDIIYQFGFGLGMSDKEHQKKNFQLIQYQIKDQIKKAEGERVKSESLYRSIGVLGGLMIVILLL